MHDGTIHITGSTRTLSLSVALAVLLFLFVLSLRTIMGAYYHGKMPVLLDDRSSEESVTLKDLSEETVPAYLEAIGRLEKAIFFDPSRAAYHKALSDIYTRLGSWAETMELMNAQLPDGTPASKDAFDAATANIREAISLQPTNPDNHLAYGHLSREMKDLDAARREYQKAVSAYPGSSALRYAVTLGYLAAGMNGEALEQAKELARIDDSYKLRNVEEKQTIMEQRAPSYLNQLYGSYLFKSFEVIWRTSDSDVNILRSVIPDNDEVRDAFELFQESKRIENK